MPTYETFAKRKKRILDADRPIIYTYGELPDAFRVQVVHIWDTAIGRPLSAHDSTEISRRAEWWKSIHDTLARELGVFRLVEGMRDQSVDDFYRQCRAYVQHAPTNDALGIIEISFRIIDIEIRSLTIANDTAFWLKRNYELSQPPDEAIGELNYRFREHAIGYQYEKGQIIEVNSQFVHSEVVEPALSLLYDENFEGAMEEFLRAHAHYRERRNREAIADALNAFESTMKTICDRLNWEYSPTATSKSLIKVIFDNELIPMEMQSELTGLRTTLESGLPTVRNKKGGHGQGSTAQVIPDYIAAYALHLAATNIVFLVDAYKTKT